MNNELHYFRCRNCSTVLTTGMKSPLPERCISCRSWLTFLFTVPIDSNELRVLERRGPVSNAHVPTPQPWTCQQCGELQPTFPRPIYRADGRCCTACYQAEAHPPLLTSDEITAREQEKQRFLLEQDDRLEAAYQQKEQERR